MGIAQKYVDSVTAILTAIVQKEQASIEKAAALVARMVEEDRLVHVFGTGGHSIMGAMEVFYRAGGLTNVNPVFPSGLSLLDSHPNIERTTGMAQSALRFYGLAKGDALIIVNVNGINAMTIDAANYGKQIGATVVAITSPEFSRNVPAGIAARHPSNKNLCDLADIVVDVHVPAGDAVLSVGGLPQKVGASSTYAVCFAGNLIMSRAIEMLVEKGVQPPVWTSANIKGGDEANDRYLKKYLPRVHHLYRM